MPSASVAMTASRAPANRWIHPVIMTKLPCVRQVVETTTHLLLQPSIERANKLAGGHWLYRPVLQVCWFLFWKDGGNNGMAVGRDNELWVEKWYDGGTRGFWNKMTVESATKGNKLRMERFDSGEDGGTRWRRPDAKAGGSWGWKEMTVARIVGRDSGPTTTFRCDYYWSEIAKGTEQDHGSMGKILDFKGLCRRA